ncbi:MAG: D-cysteine desulfhydrase family protein [bacterium]
MIAFPEKLELAVLPTPLYPLDRLSDQLGGPRIWIKRDDMTGSGLSGNKVRKLEYTLKRAMEAGADTVITCGGLQSNHCRATAIAGAQLGLNVHLVLRGTSRAKTTDGNLFLDKLCGAEISQIRPDRYLRDLDSILEELKNDYAERGKTAWIIPTGASDGHGVWGYLNCARELSRQMERLNLKPQMLFHATGSGGTQAGLTAGGHLFGLGAEVVGMAVCDNADYFLNKVRSDLADWQRLYDIKIELDDLNVQVNDRYIGPGYAKATPEVFESIKLAAQTEGLIFDPVYTGKAFHGMLSEIRKGHLRHARDIIFVHTGGIYGLMAQREEISPLLTTD